MKLENPEFEEAFVVYGGDQNEARYILSPRTMERMLEFSRKSGKKVQFSFVDSRVYVAIPYTKSLFEPKLFGKPASFERVQEYFEDLDLAMGIVEDLNLNTRIWTKT